MKWRVEIHHINVGAGDGAVLYLFDEDVSRINPQKAILIDAGTTEAGRNLVSPYLKSYYRIDTSGATTTTAVQPLDAIVITHYDSDHTGGFCTTVAVGSSSNEKTFYERGEILNPEFVGEVVKGSGVGQYQVKQAMLNDSRVVQKVGKKAAHLIPGI